MARLPLTARAFLFSFVPVCLVLATSFAALSTANHERIKHELRQSLQDSDSLLNRVNAEYTQRTARLAAKLTDSAGLRAAVGLLAETRRDSSEMPAVRRTIEAQLGELQAASTYDFAGIADLQGRTVAASILSPRDAAPLARVPLHAGLQEIGHTLYQLDAVPVEIGGEVAATLMLGTRFDLERLPIDGRAALLTGDRIVRSMFPVSWNSSLEQQLRGCTNPISGCEVVVQRHTFIVSQLETGQLGAAYRLLGFRSLDARLHQWDAAFLRTLVEVGVGGILLTFLCTLIASHSLSQPLRSLVAQLRASESAGQLPQSLAAPHGIRELDALAKAFNRVADAERRTQRELETAKDAAEAANRLKTEFLANVSHELRTPLNGVLGMTNVLLHTPLTSEQQEYATVVVDSAQSLMTLIENVLDFSSLESGTIQLKSSPFDLQECLMAVTSEIRRRAAGKNLDIEMIYPPSLPRQFVGDSTRLRQVLMHLCDNAIKFTDQGRVRINCACVGQHGADAILKLCVEDSGIGIDPRYQHLIFQRFSQVDGSFTRRYGGTGLGLTLAKQVIELLGGEIGFESRVNVGSTFWITVPLRVEPSPSELVSGLTPIPAALVC